MTDDAIFVFSMHLLPMAGHPMPNNPLEAAALLSPIVVAFDQAPTKDELRRGFMDINGFNKEMMCAWVTIVTHQYDREAFIASSQAHLKSGKPGFMSTGGQFGPWIFRGTMVPLHKKVSLDGVVSP